jgi:hypothetical protein
MVYVLCAMRNIPNTIQYTNPSIYTSSIATLLGIVEKGMTKREALVQLKVQREGGVGGEAFFLMCLPRTANCC